MAINFRYTLLILLALISFDGEAQNLKLIHDFNHGSVSSNPYFARHHSSNNIYLTAFDELNKRQLWSIDKSTLKANRVTSIYTTHRFGPFPVEVCPINNKLVFWAEDSLHGNEPWISDGTIAGTKLLADIEAGEHGSYGFSLDPFAPSRFVRVMDTIYEVVTEEEVLIPVDTSDQTTIGHLGHRYLFYKRYPDNTFWSRDSITGKAHYVGKSAFPLGISSSTLTVPNDRIQMIPDVGLYWTNYSNQWEINCIPSDRDTIIHIDTLRTDSEQFLNYGNLKSHNGSLYFDKYIKGVYCKIYKVDPHTLQKKSIGTIPNYGMESSTSVGAKMYFIANQFWAENKAVWVIENDSVHLIPELTFPDGVIASRLFGVTSGLLALLEFADRIALYDISDKEWKLIDTISTGNRIADIEDVHYFLAGDTLFISKNTEDFGTELYYWVKVPPVDQRDLLVFPNPTTGRLTIESDGYSSIAIFNTMGCRTRYFGNLEDNTIDISDLTPGTYLIRLDNGLSGKVMKY